MSSNNLFDNFDKLKAETEKILAEIKKIQNSLHITLKDNSEKVTLIKNIENIKNSIDDFKSNFASNIENSIKKIENTTFSNFQEKLNHLKELNTKLINKK